MADFTNNIWSWYIGIVAMVSIVAMFIFATRFSSRKKKPGEKAESVGHIWDEDLHELNNPLPRWWLNMYLVTIVWGIAYLILYPGLGSFSGYLNWTQENQYEKEVQAADAKYGPIYDRFLNEDLKSLVNNEDALKIGGRLFSTYCTTCHGSDAGGARGYPNLTDNDWLFGGDPETIQTTIMDGRQSAMPGWQSVIGTEGVFNVAEYVRSLGGTEVNAIVAQKGKDIYMVNCLACHGVDGKGNPLLGAPNLTDNIWLYGGSQQDIIESISKGRNGQMPPHKEFLGKAKVHLLAAYVYSLSQ